MEENPLKVIVIGLIVVLALSVTISMCSFGANVANTAIESDEMFNGMYQSIQKQGGTVKAYQGVYMDDPSPTNKQVLIASENKLRSMVADYNAKAGSFRREYFRTSDLPSHIDAETFITNHSK